MAAFSWASTALSIKSHGAADATGVSAAIKLAFTLAQSGFTERLAARVASAALPSQDDTGATSDNKNGAV